MKNKDNVKENKMHNRRKINHKEKGITLVALVITIIILLILAGITINTALSENGLFRMAKKAVNEYQEAEKQEQSALDSIAEEMEKISIDYNDYVGAYVKGYEPTGKTTGSEFIIKSETSGVTSNQGENGNTIDGVETNGDQKFTTEELEWRIWDYDKYTKTIRLISDKPTEATLTLKGATGYNNGVWAVNEICRQCYGQYDENNQMKRGISVANLKRSDIQNVSTYDFTQYKHKLGNRENGWQYDSSGDISYGSTHKYESNCYYPVMWEKDEEWSYEYKDGEGVGEDKEGLIWELENDNMKVDTAQKSCDNVELKQSSSIGHKYSNEEFKDEKYKDILFDKHYMTYWLSCRYTHLFVDHGEFGICTVEGSNGFITSEDIGGRSMIETWNQVWCQGSALRPIVSINLISSGYDLEKVEEDETVKFKLIKYN